jgi:hypothetical protein
MFGVLIFNMIFSFNDMSIYMKMGWLKPGFEIKGKERICLIDLINIGIRKQLNLSIGLMIYLIA